MASAFQKSVQRLRDFGDASIVVNDRGQFNIKAGGGIQTNASGNPNETRSIISALFGSDLADSLFSGELDSMFENNELSGTFGDEGFEINVPITDSPQTDENGLLPDIPFFDPLTKEEIDAQETGSSSTSPNGNSVGSPSASGTGATTTTPTGSNGTSSGGGEATLPGQDLNLDFGAGTGTGSQLDQQLQTQTQLAGQNAFNIQQMAADNLAQLQGENPDQNVDLGQLTSAIVQQGVNAQDDSGMLENLKRQQSLRRQRRGTASTKVKDKVQTQALLSQPTLLGDS